jgi:hypothetical protein
MLVAWYDTNNDNNDGNTHLLITVGDEAHS